jgi:hypothetical protein
VKGGCGVVRRRWKMRLETEDPTVGNAELSVSVSLSLNSMGQKNLKIVGW